MLHVLPELRNQRKGGNYLGNVSFPVDLLELWVGELGVSVAAPTETARPPQQARDFHPIQGRRDERNCRNAVVGTQWRERRCAGGSSRYVQIVELDEDLDELVTGDFGQELRVGAQVGEHGYDVLQQLDVIGFLEDPCQNVLFWVLVEMHVVLVVERNVGQRKADCLPPDLGHVARLKDVYQAFHVDTLNLLVEILHARKVGYGYHAENARLSVLAVDLDDQHVYHALIDQQLREERIIGNIRDKAARLY